MSSPNSDTYESHTRKRVGKACDRCRLKKSKCDGSSPCSRCKVDNAICVFGERKKSHDKIYPRGYVEMLEQQQHQLVGGLREMYTRLLNGDQWPGAPLQDHEGYPLTHDILDRIGVLHMKGENPVHSGPFEDDLNVACDRLMEQNGASSTRHRRSPSTDSDPGLEHSVSPTGSPTWNTTSSVSSGHSRKRGSPSTPPPEEHVTMTMRTKHQKINMPAIPSTMHLMTTEPAIMPSPEAFDLTLAFNDVSGFSDSSSMGQDLSPMLPLFSTPMYNNGMFDNYIQSDYEFAAFANSGPRFV